MARTVAVLFTLVGLLIAGSANAQQPSTDEIINKLDPNTILPKPILKGIKVIGDDKPLSIDFNIAFEFNSDKLMPDAIMTLNNLGSALKNERLAGYRFKVAGHTDAKGTPEYNQKLSERRARAVRDYLVSQYHVEPSRIDTDRVRQIATQRPLSGQNGINRRVQVINIGINQEAAGRQ